MSGRGLVVGEHAITPKLAAPWQSARQLAVNSFAYQISTQRGWMG